MSIHHGQKIKNHDTRPPPRLFKATRLGALPLPSRQGSPTTAAPRIRSETRQESIFLLPPAPVPRSTPPPNSRAPVAASCDQRPRHIRHRRPLASATIPCWGCSWECRRRRCTCLPRSCSGCSCRTPAFLASHLVAFRFDGHCQHPRVRPRLQRGMSSGSSCRVRVPGRRGW